MNETRFLPYLYYFANHHKFMGIGLRDFYVPPVDAKGN